MLQTTIDDIDSAIAASPPALTGDPRADLIELATGATFRAKYATTPEEARRHTLRAIAYLVRRLELDAPGGG